MSKELPFITSTDSGTMPLHCVLKCWSGYLRLPKPVDADADLQGSPGPREIAGECPVLLYYAVGPCGLWIADWPPLAGCVAFGPGLRSRAQYCIVVACEPDVVS